jgi:hypothetical protein
MLLIGTNEGHVMPFRHNIFLLPPPAPIKKDKKAKPKLRFFYVVSKSCASFHDL